MSVQRIDNPAGHTHGYQARAHVIGDRYVSEFFADGTHGGKRAARMLAVVAELALKRKAKRLRAQLQAAQETRR